MSTLVELFKAGGLDKYDTDKGAGQPWHHDYLKVYDQLFKDFQDKPCNILEVGYLYGGSCLLWEDYFPNANIIAIEKGDNPVLHPSLKRTRIAHMDVNDLTIEDLKGNEPDIAIDDGSHKLDDQLYFIKTVYPVLKPGGYLIIEDVQDIANDLKSFAKLGIPFEVRDLRCNTPQGFSRADDVLLIYHKSLA